MLPAILHRSHRPFHARAFTLIELLVVIAIIAILAAILFPVFAQAKAAAKTTATLSNVKQLGTSVHLYAGDSDDRTPGAWMCYSGSTDPYCGPDFFSPRSDVFVTWSTLLYPYMKNGDITMDAAQRAPVATTAPAPGSFNWGRYTTISANRLGFFEADGYNGGTYFVNKGRDISAQENLSTRAMFTTGRDSRGGGFGVFYFDPYLAVDPNYTAPDFYRNVVWDSTKSHRKLIPTVRGDSSAKNIPWDKVKKDPAKPWYEFDTTYWGAVQSNTE